MEQGGLLQLLAGGTKTQAALRLALGLDQAGLDEGVAALRAEGVQITDDGDGVVLRDACGFGAQTLSWRAGRNVSFVGECASTNDVARQLGRDGPDSLPIVVAGRQSAGRGRLGRSWEADPDGDLTMSLVLRPPVPPRDAARCVLVWAAALAEALDLWLKWPNDLVDDQGGKVGGILAELELRGDAVGFVVLGLGLNVNGRARPELPGASSLSRVRGGTVDRAEVAGAVVRAVHAVAATDLQGPFGLRRWRARAHTLGRQVIVRDGVGGVLAQGLASELRDDGALIVNGHAVLTGDVALVG
jgi:BirA family transcriptional regulator, biotin operon repressor / biotin---[acetyl-CoA-carboxylase] ligase